MKRFRLLSAALAFAAAAALSHLPAAAQVQSKTDVYMPTATLPAQTIATGVASTYEFFTNGASTLYVRIGGSPSGLSAKMQATEARSGTIAWTDMPVDLVGGGRQLTISAAGLYRMNVSGLAKVRLNVAALSSGATTVSFSAGAGGPHTVATIPAVRPTYRAAALIGTGATTHFMSITGSATKTIRVTRAECSGKATGALAVNITGEVASAADTGDAGTAVTAVPLDSNSPAATATVVSHTTSPTSGTSVGNVAAGTLALANASTPVYQPVPLVFEFGTRPGAQEVVLRGAAQAFHLNTSAAFGTGAAVGCALEWSEE